MRFELHLEETEKDEDINTLSLTNALLTFLDDFNCHAVIKDSRNVCPFIFSKDIADIILILQNSRDKFIEGLKEKDNG